MTSLKFLRMAALAAALVCSACGASGDGTSDEPKPPVGGQEQPDPTPDKPGGETPDKPGGETPDEPGELLFELVSGDRFDLSAGAHDCTVRYRIEGLLETLRAPEIRTDADWLHTYEADESSFAFLVDANGGEARTGRFELTYATAPMLCVTVCQEGGTPDGGDDPLPPAEPDFSELRADDITAQSARLSCRFGYEGTGRIESAGFCWADASGREQETRVTAAAGLCRTTLLGLTSSTAYVWYFWAVIDGERYESERNTFTTDEPPTPEVGTYRTGWAELPLEPEYDDYYYAHHICPDLKAGGHAARNYTVCFSARHHCPMWVAAPRHACYEGTVNRTNAYGMDPQIPAELQYRNTSVGGNCNKGHMLGSAERTATTAVNRQVFYYSNIAPQDMTTFNTGGGAWNNLEDWVDEQVCRDTTYVVIGTWFETYTDGYGYTSRPRTIEFGGRTDVSRPTMFYYLLLRTKRGTTGKSVMECTADELQCAAFVRSHDCAKGTKVSSKDMISVAELERITGFVYFANVPNAPKETCNPADWGL